MKAEAGDKALRLNEQKREGEPFGSPPLGFICAAIGSANRLWPCANEVEVGIYFPDRFDTSGYDDPDFGEWCAP